MQRHKSKVRGRGADGISEVVGFVIILGVVVAAMSLYLTYALPSLGREEEINEMDDVRAWFVDYKTGIDQLWLNSPIVPGNISSGDFDPNNLGRKYEMSRRDEINRSQELFNATAGQVTLRRVINAGTLKEKGFVERYLPLLAPIPSSAEVSVAEGGFLDIWAIADGVDYTVTPSIPATTLGYASHNNYWLQQQYYYQLGGIFLRQWDLEGGAEAENVTLISAPPLSIYDDLGDRTRVQLVVVNLSAETGGFAATSPIRVETRLETCPVYPVNDTGAAWPTKFSEVSLTFRGTSALAAEEWAKVFSGVGNRTDFISAGTPFSVTRPSNTTARINITGHNLIEDDVPLEVLLANYTMRLENVPTLIE